MNPLKAVTQGGMSLFFYAHSVIKYLPDSLKGRAEQMYKDSNYIGIYTMAQAESQRDPANTNLAFHLDILQNVMVNSHVIADPNPQEAPWI